MNTLRGGAMTFGGARSDRNFRAAKGSPQRDSLTLGGKGFGSHNAAVIYETILYRVAYGVGRHRIRANE
jgi:hypothetical protein